MALYLFLRGHQGSRCVLMRTSPWLLSENSHGILVKPYLGPHKLASSHCHLEYSHDHAHSTNEKGSPRDKLGEVEESKVFITLAMV